MAIYEDPVLKAVIDTIKGSNSDITTYYQGDPIMIAKDYLPACIVQKDATVVPNATNVDDEHHLAIVITIVTDIRKNFLASDTEGKADILVPGYTDLYEIIEKRNSTDCKLESTAILDIIRKNRTLGTSNIILDVDLRTPTRVEYGITLGKRGENLLSVEANVFINVNFMQNRKL